MDAVSRHVDQLSQGILAMSTQEQLGMAAVTVMGVGLVAWAIWLFFAPDRVKETGTMAPPVTLKQSDKGLLTEILTNGVEDRVMFRKLNRRTARRLYDAVGRCMDIPELRYTGDLKSVIKSRRAYQKSLNGHAPKPPNIPGEKPIQELKPNQFKSTSKEKVKSLFKKTTPASA